MNAKELIRDTERLLLTQQHCTLEEATAPQLHNALSTAAMEALTPLWVRSQRKRAGKRQAYYLSAEYLMGRMVYNNLYCLGLLDDARKLLEAKGVDLTMLEDIEDDAFGNGGLGRLAACFLDSAATINVPRRASWSAARTRSPTTGPATATPGASAGRRRLSSSP